jgi:hypothetical protein
MRRLLAVAVAGAVAIAGCGSEGTSSGRPGDGGSSGGGSEFSKLLAKTKAAKYKITYQRGEDTPFTVAQDPPRFSWTSGSSATYVTADDSVVSCSGTGPSATCTDQPGIADSIKQGLTSAFGAIGALFVTEAGKGIPGLGAIKTTDKSIAGRDAACATIDGGILGDLGAAIKGSYSVCVDKKLGVILESNADDGNGHTFDVKATEFGTPTDADLTPPVTPTTTSGVTTPS